ncbi:MAG: hypothetical protein KA206_11185 [Paludibacter sp.]|nr:hypothetical protein [Paludibacter sp.]
MKKITFLLSVCLVLLLTACESGVTKTVTYKINEPVLMTKAEFRSTIKMAPQPIEITNFGKICFYEGYLFVSESEKGIHIIDNRNPASPQNLGFIEVPGNADLAVRDNLLYADSFVDLVWFDISNPAKPTFKGRLADIFPTSLPIMDNMYGYNYNDITLSQKDSVIVGWKVVERTENVDEYSGNGGWWGWGGGMAEDGMYTLSSSTSTKSTGINGSMSRFALYDNKLYAVLRNQISIFDLATSQPTKVGESMYIGGDVETIFSYKENMFMGTPTGMLIYSVKDPVKPEFQSRISHAYGCDPVVVDNDLAYVTIHDGNNCGQSNNELFIVDVKDVKNPKQLVSFSMTKPKGLGVDAGKLFLCDDGLKVFQITDDPQKLTANQLKHIKGMDGYDLIPTNNTLMMIAADGLYQYDYSNMNDMKFLSKLAFAKK